MINQLGLSRDVVTIGASAGGVEVLLELFARLPGDIPGAFGVVLHRSPVFESDFAGLLQRRSKLRCYEPSGGETIEHGHVYVAPRDRHMLFDGETIRLDRGPKQHFTRPAVDPLFMSAARSLGARVVGVVLTGGGDDGASGLIAIKQAGGITMVQDPREAKYPSMPTHGIIYDDLDAVLKLAQICEVLVRLAHGEMVPDEGTDPVAATLAREAAFPG